MKSSSPAASVPLTDMFKLGFLAVGLGFLYYPIFLDLTKDWLENDNYSHGFFIPAITLYMIYTLREDLLKQPAKPANTGLLLLLFGLAQLLIAKIGSEFFLQRTSIIPVLLGISLFLFGYFHTRKILVPICFLLFMVPLPAIVWNRIAFPMQLFSTAMTENIVHLMNIPVLREGNILVLAETTLEVVDACSGLRSLVTMFALSATFAWLAHLSVLKKWILFFSAAPIAIFANIVRLAGTAVLANHFGEKVAQGFLHEASGIVTFILGLSLLGALYSFLHKDTSCGK